MQLKQTDVEPDDKLLLSRRTILKGVVGSGAALAVAGLAEAADAVPANRPAADDKRGVVASGGGAVREYWLQVDAVPRTLVSSNRDDLIGRVFTPNESTYQSLVFRAFEPNWQAPLRPNMRTIGDNSGIPGPVIRGYVGDEIVIHFRNNDTHYNFPHSIHAHGLLYTPENDGMWTAARPKAPGTAVLPGHTYTYRYKALPSSVGTWVYHDHSIPQTLTGDAPVMDMNVQLGMFGLIAIEQPETTPADREHILYFHQMYASDIPTLAQDYACLNGRAFLPNTPTFHANVGERVRWRIGALGQEFYVFHLHGHRWLASGGEYRDTEIIGPSTTATVEYVEDNPGQWFYQCCSTAHLVNGMIGQYIAAQSTVGGSG